MHMNAVWQSLYVCATKNSCALLTFTEHFVPLVRLQDFEKRTFWYFTLWVTTALDDRDRRFVHAPSARPW